MIDLAYIFLELENVFFHICINYCKTKSDQGKSMVEDSVITLVIAHILRGFGMVLMKWAMNYILFLFFF